MGERRATRKQVTEAREACYAAFEQIDDDTRYTNWLAITYFTNYSTINDENFSKKSSNAETVRRFRRLEAEVMRSFVDPTFGREVGESVYWKFDEDEDLQYGTIRYIHRNGREAYAAVEKVDGSLVSGELDKFLNTNPYRY